jgi:surface polysaccharide O-acyltransferase-like enzyme
MPNEGKMYEKLDAARWMAALAVVMVHCAAYPLTRTTDYSSNAWLWANFYDAAARWCVPVFVMISGALLLNPTKNDGFRRFYKRRGWRVIPPIAFWTIFYLLWGAWMYRLQGVEMDLMAWLRKISGGEPYYHLWYLYMLVGLYLFAPYIRLIYARCRPRQRLAAFAAILLISMSDTLYREIMHDGQYGFFLVWFLPYISYFLAGRLMVEGHLRLPYPLLWLAVSVVVTVWGAHSFSDESGLNVYFYDAFGLTVPLMSLAVFQAILNARRLPLLSAVAPLTFGIYLIHPVFLDIAKQMNWYGPAVGTSWKIPLTTAAIFVLSLALAAGLRRVPGGRWVM